VNLTKRGRIQYHWLSFYSRENLVVSEARPSVRARWKAGIPWRIEALADARASDTALLKRGCIQAVIGATLLAIEINLDHFKDRDLVLLGKAREDFIGSRGNQN
jgi:hypothetical protein